MIDARISGGMLVSPFCCPRKGTKISDVLLARTPNGVAGKNVLPTIQTMMLYQLRASDMSH